MKTQTSSQCPDQFVEQIYHNIERAILKLEQKPIIYGMFFFGIVQAGITTSCHYLTNVALEGVHDNNKNLVYKLGSSASKAKIGLFEGQTQTKTINFFKTTLKPPTSNPNNTHIPNPQHQSLSTIFQDESQQQNQQQNYIHLIDCPGAMNSQWLHRYFRNHIYHYLIFSKIQYLKFVITFTYGDMAKTAHMMLKTFCQFFKMFKTGGDEEEERRRFVESVCVLVTNVPVNVTSEDLLLRFEKSPSIQEHFEQIYAQVKCNIIQKKLLFIFNSPKDLNQSCNVLNKTLKQMNKSTKFWKRTLLTNGTICMKNISDCFPTFTQYNQEVSNRSIVLLKNYYSNTVRKRLLDLYQVVHQLVKDCRNGDNSCKFLEKMIEKGRNYHLEKIKYFPKHLHKGFIQKTKKLREKIFKQLPLSFNKFDTDIKLSVNLMFELNKIQSYGRIVEFGEQFKEFQHPWYLYEVETKTLGILMTLAKMFRQGQENNGMKQVQIFIYEIWIKMRITSIWSEHCEQIFTDFKFKYKTKFFYYDYSLYQHRTHIRDIILKSASCSLQQVMQACIKKNKLPPLQWSNIIIHLAKFRTRLSGESEESKIQNSERKCMMEVVSQMTEQMKGRIGN